MAHYEDLAPIDYFGRWQEVLRAVGWLAADKSFPRGPSSQAFFIALIRLLQNPWHPAAVVGRHPCAICQFSGGPAEICFDSMTVRIGESNLFIPFEHGVYVARTRSANCGLNRCSS
jgi:hypothetical protein